MLSPGDTIGILGGGQLGRMLCHAAAELGLRTHVFCPDPDSPAFRSADGHTCADYADGDAIARFGAAVDLVTYEFENVPLDALAMLARHAPVAPSAQSLAMSQDRIAEKTFLERAGVPIAAYRPVDDEADLVAALEALGGDVIVKTRRMGYDGKGQARVSRPGDAAAAWDKIGRAPAVAEAVIPFVAETSSVLARARDGSLAHFDMPLNEHASHVLKWSRLPGPLGPASRDAAGRHAAVAAAALGHVGVFTIEWFVLRDGDGERLIANETAPRVHNSGHWTMDAALTSQFEQHIRAIAGWPLGDCGRTAPVVMENLLGDEIDRWHAILAEPRARLHLYGKGSARPGRKMGHVNWLGSATAESGAESGVPPDR